MTLCAKCHSALSIHNDLTAILRELDAIRAMLRTPLKADPNRPPGKITPHWLSVALDCVCAGEQEAEVLADYGWQWKP